MKKKIIIVISVVVALILLVPINVNHLKDGGTVEYKALLYKVTKVHRLNGEEKKVFYQEGFIIEVFGIEMFNNVK